MRFAGIRVNRSLGINGKQPDPLRIIFKKILHDYTSGSPEIILKLAIKCMNINMGKYELVPSCLVSGILPRFPILISNLSYQKAMIEIIKTARAEVSFIIAERKVTAALTKNVPSTAGRNYKPNDEVLKYDEQPQQWKGAYIVLDYKDRTVTVTY